MAQPLVSVVGIDRTYQVRKVGTFVGCLPSALETPAMPRLPARVERPLSMSLGAAVLAARLRAALTQAEVARRVGVLPEVYGRIERGEMFPSVLTLRRLCLTLEIPSDELLGLEVPESLDMDRLVSAARGLKSSQLRLLHRLAESLLPPHRE